MTLHARAPQIASPGFTAEEIKRALVYMAYVVTTYGPVYAPIFERLERELEAARRAEDPINRARRLLEAHTLDGGFKAIR